MNETPVTVIGLGAMGTALAEAFLRSGNPTTVWNRTNSRAKPLVTKGAVEASTLREAIQASPLVIVCVVNYDAMHEILDPVAEELTGHVLVNLSNGSPRQARETAQWAKGHGAEYVDGGIMAIPPMIGGADASVFYSGSQSAFAEHQSTLEALGTARNFGSDAGLAALYDIALLTGMYGSMIGFLQSIALATSEGMKATEFLKLLGPWMASMGSTMSEAAEQIDTRSYRDGVASPLGMQAAAFGNFSQTYIDQGLHPDLMMPLQKLMNEAVAAGYGDANTNSMIELIRQPKNEEPSDD